MKKFFIALSACLLLLACGQSREQKDIALITDLYERVLCIKPMTDEFLKDALTDQLLESIWEADYDDAYSYWVFRTVYQDGPESESTLGSIQPLGDGWYRVTYSDMGNPGTTDVQVCKGKVCAYKTVKSQDTYLKAIDRYMAIAIGGQYLQGEYSIPYSIVVAADESNVEDIKVWGDFWVMNYNKVADTLKTVSGGNHPGLMHVSKKDDNFSVTAFDALEDGAGLDKSAKKIFGEYYEPFMAVYSDDKAQKAAREKSLADFVTVSGLSATYYQDYGWDAVAIPVQ